MKVPITFLLFLLTTTGMGQLNDSDAFFRGNYDKTFIQKHKIKQIIVNMYLNKRLSNKFLFDFDKRGFLIKETSFDGDGKKASDYIFIYNTKGDQIERKEISYTLTKTYSTKFEKTYSNSQLDTENSSEFPFVTKHSYNKKGQKIQSVTILGNDSNANKKNLRYSYDNKGRIISCEETLTYGNSLTSVNTVRTNYQYDTYGNIITVVRIDNPALANGQMNFKLKYSKNGLLVSKSVNVPDFGGMDIVDKYSYLFWK